MNRKLKIDQVKLIPDLLESGLNYQQIAEKLNVSKRTINYWIRRLKNANVKLVIRKGPKPLKLR